MMLSISYGMSSHGVVAGCSQRQGRCFDVYQVTTEELTATADAIRTKSDTSEPIEWQATRGFSAAILDGCQADLDRLVTRTITQYHSNVDRVSHSAFRGCADLVSVALPECLYIRQLAFRSCSSLPEIILPACVSIQAEAFAYCSELRKIVLLSDTVCVLDNANAFSNTPIARGEGSIEVPAALVEAYKAAAGWSTYAGAIRAYEGGGA
jgi:hypothetical protein